jgi:polyisoprenoid-binding protein YceI
MQSRLRSRECSRRRAGVVVAVILISSAVPATADSYKVVSAAVTAVCRLTIGGSFEARSAALTGTVALDPERGGQLTGDLTFDLETLETGIRLRDNHLRERYLEVQSPENRQATLTDIQVEGLDLRRFAPGSYRFRARLRLRGHERDVAGKVEIRVDGRRLRADAVFPIQLSDFEIRRPTYLGIGISDELTVHVKLAAMVADQLSMSTESSR